MCVNVEFLLELCCDNFPESTLFLETVNALHMCRSQIEVALGEFHYG